MADLCMTKDLLRFLWASDEYQFSHPRVRLQLAYALLLLATLGSRPGEVIESSV